MPMDPSILGGIYETNPGAFWQAQGQVGLQKNQEEQNLQRLIEANAQAQRINPLEVQQKRLANQTTEAQLPGIIGMSQQQAVKGRLAQDTEQETKRATLQKLTQEMSDGDLEIAKNQIRSRAMQGDPKAIQAMELFEDVIKEKAKQKYMADRQMELERLRGENQLAAVRAGNEGRLAVKQAGSSGSKTGGDIFAQIVSGKIKGAKNIHAALITAASQMDNENPLKAQYLQAAEQVRAQAEAEIAAPKPGGIDVPAATNLPAQGGPSIAPRGAQPERKPIGMSRGKPVFAGDVLVKDGKQFVVQEDGSLKAK